MRRNENDPVFENHEKEKEPWVQRAESNQCFQVAGKSVPVFAVALPVRAKGVALSCFQLG